jgi:hypothetical protein
MQLANFYKYKSIINHPTESNASLRCHLMRVFFGKPTHRIQENQHNAFQKELIVDTLRIVRNGDCRKKGD